MTNETYFKLSALLRFIYEEEGEEVDPKDCTKLDDNTFELPDGSEFLVLTDDEADEKAKEYIKETLWAFNAGFILSTCGLNSNKTVL